jgi:malonyl-CoA/methylmalonyl-CoA synthetase
LSTLDTIALIERAQGHAERTALIDDDGRMTYAQLLSASTRAASCLLAEQQDLAQARVAFLVPPSIDYVVAAWGTWRAGGIAVPLCTTHPSPELEQTIGDSGATILVAHPSYRAVLAEIAERRRLRLLSSDQLRSHAPVALPRVQGQRGAMLLYTSGTTGKPKGVLSTHAILAAQIRSVVQAWEWTERDHILHVLPLHHLHGVLNALCCALWAGACCELFPRFDAERVLRRIASGSDVTLFMAVPTIYAKLIEASARATPEERGAIREGCLRLRLMVSGSAALPVAVLDAWRSISGHTLLERYGMTEFGMGLGNPLHGERRPGHVGAPFPGVDARLCDEHGSPVADGEPGQLEIKGDGVFQTYWNRPEATRDAFTKDGWFKTGDVAVREQGSFRILGRASVDILKTGGFKVSALEIEEALREHPAILECAVVGVSDETWGQRVAAAVVLRAGMHLELEGLRTWGKLRLAPYKVPTLLRLLTELPRNPMGKVQKPELVALFDRPSAS